MLANDQQISVKQQINHKRHDNKEIQPPKLEKGNSSPIKMFYKMVDFK